MNPFQVRSVSFCAWPCVCVVGGMKRGDREVSLHVSSVGADPQFAAVFESHGHESHWFSKQLFWGLVSWCSSSKLGCPMWGRNPLPLRESLGF